jgi:hypothetical protein
MQYASIVLVLVTATIIGVHAAPVPGSKAPYHNYNQLLNAEGNSSVSTPPDGRAARWHAKMRELGIDPDIVPEFKTSRQREKWAKGYLAQKKAEEEAAQHSQYGATVQSAQRHVDQVHRNMSSNFHQGVSSLPAQNAPQFAPVDVQQYSGQGESFMDLNQAQPPHDYYYSGGSGSGWGY